MGIHRVSNPPNTHTHTDSLYLHCTHKHTMEIYVSGYRDFCDDSFVQNHLMFKRNRDTLLLSFYFDELEVANPLGSKRGKYKLGIIQVHILVYRGKRLNTIRTAYIH